MEKQSLTDDKIRVLEQLVSELLKDEPEEKLVQSCMQQAGLEYTLDPIERMNRVLQALHLSN